MKPWLVMMFIAAPIFAAGPQASPADLSAIQGVVQKWDTAWNRHDAKAIASLLTDDADTVNRYGLYFHDRAETKLQLDALLSGPFRTVQCPPQEITSIRLIRADVAVVRTEWEAPEDVRNGPEAPRTKMIVSYVMTRDNGTWMIAGMDLHTVRGASVSDDQGKQVPPGAAATH